MGLLEVCGLSRLSSIHVADQHVVLRKCGSETWEFFMTPNAGLKTNPPSIYFYPNKTGFHPSNSVQLLLGVCEARWDTRWPATPLKPLTAEVNNTYHLPTVQRSAGKTFILAFSLAMLTLHDPEQFLWCCACIVLLGDPDIWSTWSSRAFGADGLFQMASTWRPGWRVSQEDLKWSMLFTSTVSALNVMADRCIIPQGLQRGVLPVGQKTWCERLMCKNQEENSFPNIDPPG